MFINVKATQISIHNDILIAIGPGLEERHEIPTELTGAIKFRVVFNSYHVLQVGDLAAQMTLQGRPGMAKCRCIKCNLTQSEWKSGLGHTLLKKAT